jgi:hypothetical protein
MLPETCYQPPGDCRRLNLAHSGSVNEMLLRSGSLNQQADEAMAGIQ